MTTNAEKAWMDAITQLGCIVCYLMGFPGTPAVPHHILSGGRRIGHLHTIPLCDPGHHQNANRFLVGRPKISRHPNKARFEAEYGTEEFLLAKTKELINQAPAACNADHSGGRLSNTMAWGPTN